MCSCLSPGAGTEGGVWSASLEGGVGSSTGGPLGSSGGADGAVGLQPAIHVAQIAAEQIERIAIKSLFFMISPC